MKNITGQVVRGEDFFGRERELAHFWREVETDNLLLLAPRRVGKTSLLERMRETAFERGYTAVYADVSDAADERAFVQRLYAAVLESDAGNGLWNKVKDSWLANTIRRVKKLGGAGFTVELDAGETDWHRLGRELAEALSCLERRWFIQVDELPVFALKLLQGGDPAQRARVRDFLYWMRRVRLEFPGVRWILAGSIGLDTVAARFNLADTINDLKSVSLGAFEPDTADQLLIRLGESYEISLSAAVRQRVVERIGWPIPYYLQLVFSELRNRATPVPPTLEDVDRAFDHLLTAAHRGYFDFWRQRLHDELGRPDSEHATALLNLACRDDAGVTRETLSHHLARMIADADARHEKLSYLLDVLESDGYVVAHQGRWQLRVPLLREYWRMRVAP